MKNLRAVEWLPLLVILAFLAGCSSDAPVESMDSGFAADNSRVESVEPPDDQIRIEATLATIDSELRQLTFEEVDYVVTVPEDCPIVQVEEGVETPLVFADLQVGDFLKVCGLVQEDGTVCAKKIVVYLEPDCEGHDLVFKDTVATIDYASGTFTVVGRSETILVDENTYIFGHYPSIRVPESLTDNERGTGLLSLGDDDVVGHGVTSDTLFEFTDIQPGYVVEVKADIIDAETLLAASIKLLTCNLKPCYRFEDYLATIDTDNRLVTFETEAWVGNVCPGALLLDADGTALLLSDFAVGDLVTVKGTEIEADDLKICEMTRQ